MKMNFFSKLVATEIKAEGKFYEDYGAGVVFPNVFESHDGRIYHIAPGPKLDDLLKQIDIFPNANNGIPLTVSGKSWSQKISIPLLDEVDMPTGRRDSIDSLQLELQDFKIMDRTTFKLQGTFDYQRGFITDKGESRFTFNEDKLFSFLPKEYQRKVSSNGLPDFEERKIQFYLVGEGFDLPEEVFLELKSVTLLTEETPPPLPVEEIKPVVLETGILYIGEKDRRWILRNKAGDLIELSLENLPNEEKTKILSRKSDFIRGIPLTAKMIQSSEKNFQLISIKLLAPFPIKRKLTGYFSLEKQRDSDLLDMGVEQPHFFTSDSKEQFIFVDSPKFKEFAKEIDKRKLSPGIEARVTLDVTVLETYPAQGSLGTVPITLEGFKID